MNSQLQRQYEARADIIKAMAHPSRLFIVEELKKQDRNVGELTEMIGSDASTVSKHLSILKNAGILSDEKKGTTVTYHLQTPCILNFVGCVEEVLVSRTRKQTEILSACKKVT
jgi:ArsR family transcriptional regulator, arsenate/arsenite/antimonite-responsive transcriptional repressor